MKAAQDLFDTAPGTVGFFVVFLLVALGGGLISAASVAHALAGNFAAAAPGAAVGAVGGPIGHLARLLMA